MEAVAITEDFLKEYYVGQETHLIVLQAVREGAGRSELARLFPDELGLHIDTLLGHIYEGLPQDPKIVIERVRKIGARGFSSDASFIASRLEELAYCINTERGIEVIPITDFYEKRHNLSKDLIYA